MVKAELKKAVLNDKILDLYNTRQVVYNSNGKLNKELFQEKCDEYFFRQLMVLTDFERQVKNITGIDLRKRGKRKNTLLRLMQEKEAVNDGEYTLDKHVLDMYDVMREATKRGYRPFNIREAYESIIEFNGDTTTHNFDFRLVYYNDTPNIKCQN